jgi:hypothetical protein
MWLYNRCAEHTALGLPDTLELRHGDANQCYNTRFLSSSLSLI